MAQQAQTRSAPVDEQLCFAIYAASRAMTGYYRPLLDAVGLTYPQYLVMLVLWERGEATVTGIGQALQLETGTLSPLLRRLEALGLVCRDRQVADQRSVVVSLTPAGRALNRDVISTQKRVGEATGLSRAESVELHEALHGLTGRLRSVAD
jgi:DNA-binding MarR family transcriptional regulator